MIGHSVSVPALGSLPAPHVSLGKVEGRSEIKSCKQVGGTVHV